MDDKEKYMLGIRGSGIHVGDMVRVLKGAENNEAGWNNSWPPEMDAYIGREFVVISYDEGQGFELNRDEDSFYFPYFVLEKITSTTYNIVDEFIDTLRKKFPHGHPDFIPMTIDEMDLHSRKNHDFAQGGKPTGNFDRVSAIKKLYPGLDWTTPAATAIDYLLKQFDAAMWLECQKLEAIVEGIDDRWRDISVYAKLIRLLKKEESI